MCPPFPSQQPITRSHNPHTSASSSLPVRRYRQDATKMSSLLTERPSPRRSSRRVADARSVKDGAERGVVHAWFAPACRDATRAAPVDGSPRPPRAERTDDGPARPVVDPVPQTTTTRVRFASRPLRKSQHDGDSTAWAAPGPVPALVAVCVSLLLWRFCFADSGGWTGDPRVNVPISTLGLGNIRVVEEPFPVSELIVLARTYAAVYYHLSHPASSFLVDLRLDAPGLQPVDIRTWLAEAHQRFASDWPAPMQDRMHANLPRLAEDPSILVVHSNTTLTMELMAHLWHPLMLEAYDLLVVGLGLQHPEFAALRDALGPTPKRDRLEMTGAPFTWRKFQRQACKWPAEASSFLSWFHDRLERGACTTPDGERDAVEEGRVGSHAPFPQQLLRLEDTRRKIGGRRQALPQLLAGIRLSHNASVLLEQTHRILRGKEAFGMDEYASRTSDWCTDPAFLAVVARGQCPPNKTSLFVTEPHLDDSRTSIRSERLLLEMLTDDLCEVEAFLRPLATAMVRIRDRVQAAVDERGGISRLEYLLSYVRDGIVRRMAVVDRGLGAFLPLVSSIDLHRRLLAGVALSMQQACRLQDELRARVDALHAHQSARWRLEWDANSGTAVVTFVTFPELADVMLQVESELDRLKAASQQMWYNPDDMQSLAWKLQGDLAGVSAAKYLRTLGLDSPLPPLHLNPNWYPTRRTSTSGQGSEEEETVL